MGCGYAELTVLEEGLEHVRQVVRERHRRLGMRRRIMILLLMIMASSSVLVGCASGRLHATINRDGSAELVSRIILDPTLSAFVGDERLLDYLQAQIEEQGFAVTRFNQDGQIGLEASKHLERAAELVNLLQPAMAGNPVTSSFEAKEKLLWTDYTLNVIVDLASLPINLDLIPGYLLQAVLSQLDLEVALTLPVIPTEHNAESVSEDGKTLSWQVKSDQPNHLRVQARVPNLRNIGLLSVTALVVALILFVAQRRLRG